MTYDEAIKYIHSTSNFFCKPGLDRIRELCRGLGNPQKGLRYIHVTGTNGKGSVCAMLDSMLRAAGYKVGLYTSPYILRFNERIRVNGESISDEYLACLTERAKAVAEKMKDSPTEFELITAIAFDYFEKEKCDIVVLEVGMGGELDATNIIEDSILSIVTGIALDHTSFLGDTVEQIAKEKAGIIKEYSTLLLGDMPASCEEIFREKAARMQTVVYKYNPKWLKIISSDLDGASINYKQRYNLKLPLLGSYQAKNAVVALGAIDLINDCDFYIGQEAVSLGLSNVRWRARFEIINRDPTVIFDGAHNPQGIRAAVDSVKNYFKDQKIIVVSGVLRDKDYREIARTISEVASKAFTITPGNPRALSAEEYADVLKEEGVIALPCPDVREAMKLAIAAAKEEDKAICCLGSLYTYGEVIEAINDMRADL